jgi:dephospho-CoA kinase
MLVVGLTGGIASGKSTVSRMFEEAGVPVICADQLAREAVDPASPLLEEIRGIFGDTVIDGEGRLDREAMASVVFQDESRRKDLESIIHPWVLSETERRIGILSAEGHQLVIVDVPLLYEIGWFKGFDKIIVVYVPEAVQATRLSERNHMDSREVAARLRAQMPIAEKRRRADMVVDNSGTIEHTRDQVEAILTELRTMTAARMKGSERAANT